MSDKQYSSFRDEDVSSHEGDDAYSLPSARYSRPTRSRSSLWMHLGLVVVYTLVAGLVVSHYRSQAVAAQAQLSASGIAKDEVEAPYSPARVAVEYELQPLHEHIDNSPYIGEPRPELDQAWKDLLDGTVVRLTDEEMIRQNKTSIGLLDGGWVANMDVYHQLHCLKRIKQYKHWDLYFSDLTPEEAEHMIGHFDHCLEVLRVAVMCHADVDMNTFSWSAPGKKKPETISSGYRKCVNWAKLDAWARSRPIPWEQEGLGLYQYGEEGSQGPKQENALVGESTYHHHDDGKHGEELELPTDP